ncbi:DUF2130 domain-containing protein [Larkinella sp. C7]|uniref:DUF2130 domain-containing protein n=1 Tax=Larkinella sp. C7 TaxID=2576607 RepID=UPI0011111C0B|nr:DUF2130 domain-containing protein [Larkinella sp. C7]
MMATLTCPHCSEAIDFESTLVHQIKNQLTEQQTRQFAGQQKALDQRAEALKQQQAQLNQQSTAQQEEVERLLREQRVQLVQQLKKQLQAEQNTELDQLKDELREKSTRIRTMQQQELDLRRQQRQLEEQRDAMGLEVEKRLQSERQTIEQKAIKKARDESQFHADQQQGIIDSMALQLSEMKRRIEQGSQQVQGEVQEVALEKLLADAFPFDQIEEVSKGISGADVVHTVRNEFGQICGRIIYESKRTKAFSPAWIGKLKSDLQAHKGDIAVLVTETMPKGSLQFGDHEGIWVCSFQEVRALACVLRQGVLRVAEVQALRQNQGEKMQVLYNYLTSTEFRQCMEGIVQTFRAMQDGLEKEKRATKRQWAEREKLIEAVIDNSACMYGSMRAIAGGAVAQIDGFEMEAEENPLLL